MKNKLKTFVNISIVVVLVITIHFFGWLNPIEDFIRDIINPGSQKLYEFSLKINENEEHFSSVKELEDAYKVLKETENKNTIDNIELGSLKKENKELRELLGFLQKTNYTYLGADVIGKNIDPIGNNIIINRGEVDGIKKDLAVITGPGFLVGKIKKVEKNSSIVQLINDNNSKIASTIINVDGSLGLIEGGYGISVHMNYIPQNEEVNPGDEVITSGLEENVPHGLLIGTIAGVEREPYQPFQRAIITPKVNLEKIENVSILLVSEKKDN